MLVNSWVLEIHFRPVTLLFVRMCGEPACARMVRRTSPLSVACDSVATTRLSLDAVGVNAPLTVRIRAALSFGWKSERPRRVVWAHTIRRGRSDESLHGGAECAATRRSQHRAAAHVARSVHVSASRRQPRLNAAGRSTATVNEKRALGGASVCYAGTRPQHAAILGSGCNSLIGHRSGN